MSKEVNKHVEFFKTNMFLEAAKYLGEDNLEDIFLVKALGIMGEVPYAEGQLIFGKYRLIIEWDLKHHSNIEGKTDTEKEEYIKNHTDELFEKYAYKHSDYIYVLNIAMEGYTDVRFECTFKAFKASRIKLFFPVIQLFIAKALTDTMEK